MADSDLVRRFEEAAAANRSTEEAAAARADLDKILATGITSIGELIAAVADPRREVEVRLIGCSLLTWLGVREATGALERAFIETEDDGLAWESAKALERLGAESAAPVLVRALSEGSAEKRTAAAWLLGLLGVPDTIPPLRGAAFDNTLPDAVRGHAIEALGYLRDREAVTKLIGLLQDASPELRYWAAYALGQIGSASSIPALTEMAKADKAVLPGDRSLRAEALEALESIRNVNRKDS